MVAQAVLVPRLVRRRTFVELASRMPRLLNQLDSACPERDRLGCRAVNC
jgi:hypothetical protein